jgi:hypothetical protein
MAPLNIFRATRTIKTTVASSSSLKAINSNQARPSALNRNSKDGISLHSSSRRTRSLPPNNLPTSNRIMRLLPQGTQARAITSRSRQIKPPTPSLRPLNSLPIHPRSIRLILSKAGLRWNNIRKGNSRVSLGKVKYPKGNLRHLFNKISRYKTSTRGSSRALLV